MGRGGDRTSRSRDINLALGNLSAYTALVLLRCVGAWYSTYVQYGKEKLAVCDLDLGARNNKLKAVKVRVEYFENGKQVKGNLISLLIHTIAKRDNEGTW